ncbi:helix-turn-helix domain-containing protein [Enterococcus termitis]|uniref:Mga helix-turn-helix domain-containing protein n=1 Tax=Enterococcus termitis TaxID=332950 RepID=A0A1E5GAR3_9ENTE|nr:helix-turn-helix domain-containing protein [Enterococcus termitis]OEG09783.1 hypothetical protein BCR25_09755 [Enterococcus termitis]OJG96913.1 hypothetical protein RV18_GL001751 [Enterococcus termitis]
MIQFLDNSLQKKYRILEVINNSVDYSATQNQILDELNISLGTLKRSVKLIEEDFQAFGCEDKIQLTYNEESKAYNLMIAENFSLQFIRLYYLENSIRFKLIEGMFTDTLGDMSEVADQLYLTYSSLRRELHYLKKELQLYDLTIDTKKKIKIKGNELHIRLFYTILYLDSYGGQSWPYQYIHQHDIHQICTLFPSEIYNPAIAAKRILLSFFTANSLVRAKNGHLIDYNAIQVPLFDSQDASYEQSLDELGDVFKKMLPLLGENLRRREIQALLSCVLAFGSYPGVVRASKFFYLNKELQEQDFLSSVFHLMNQLESFALSTITNDEYNSIFNKICLLHYRILLFNNTSFINLPIWADPNDDLVTYNRQRIALFTKAIENEFSHPTMSKFTDYKNYLLYEYHNILLHTLDWEKHKPNIRVLFLSKFGSHKLETLVTNAFQALYNFDTVNELSPQVDMIVSDMILSDQTISGIGATQPIIYVQPTISLSDYRKVSKKLAELTWKKLKKNIDTLERTDDFEA